MTGDYQGPAVPLDMQSAQLLQQLLPPSGASIPGLMDVGVDAARAGSRAFFHGYAGSEPEPCSTEDVRIEVVDRVIPARLYHTPVGDWRDLPLVVFLHGGGWFQGDVDCYDYFMRDVCVRSGANVLSVEYRLAPEHKYPAGLDDGLAAMDWAARFLRLHTGNATPLAVMGDSAGGNLATVIARRLHVEERIRLAAQFLLYPMLDVSQPHSAYPSRIHFGNGEYLLAREHLDTAATWYLDGFGRRDDPDISPLLASDLHVLPETVIIVGGYDPLLDEARLYARRLTAAGVPTHLETFATTMHAFLSFGVLDVAQQGRAYLAGQIRRCLFGSD